MNKVEKIIKKYSGEGQNAAGEILFPHGIAMAIVKECRLDNITIIGINLWKKTNGNIQEINSTDYSTINTIADSARLTNEAVLKLIANGLPESADFVSFVLDDR